MTKKVILVSGKLQSGKNTFTDFLIDFLGLEYTIDYDYFAKPLKDECKDVFSNLISYLNNIGEKHNIQELKTFEESWYENKNEITRILLQTYGTNIFRDLVDQDWWAKKLSNKIYKRSEDIIIVSDVRFKSELKIMEESNFELIKIRIERSNYERDDNPIHLHQSELDLDDYGNWDHVVYNNETLEVLKENAFRMAEIINKQFFIK